MVSGYSCSLFTLFSPRAVFSPLFHSFTECTLSVPGSHLGYHVTFSHASLGSFWLWSFLRVSLFLMTLAMLRNISQVFCRMFLSWDLSDSFLMIRLGLRAEGESPQKKSHFHPDISRIFTISMTCHCWCWLWSPGWGRICQISHCKVTLFSHFHTVLFGRMSLWRAHFKGGKYSTPLR